MRLCDAILEANQHWTSGDRSRRIRSDQYPDALPVAALTCIDARLNHLLPDVLGVLEADFIWLRNAGNIITGPLSSTMRSLALACAVKGAKEVAIIGHTDCLVSKTSLPRLTEELGDLGVDRSELPENLVEYFGLFASERENVIEAVGVVRQSPLIGPRVPVHGLLVDIGTGKLEWLVNGYQLCAAIQITAGVPEPIGELARVINQALRYTVVGGDQKQYGPISGAKLLEWLAEERIDAKTQVQVEGSSAWTPLSALAGLLKSGKTLTRPHLPTSHSN